MEPGKELFKKERSNSDKFHDEAHIWYVEWGESGEVQKTVGVDAAKLAGQEDQERAEKDTGWGQNKRPLQHDKGKEVA